MIAVLRVAEGEFRRVNPTEVKTARGLLLAHGQAEGPTEGGKVVKDVIREVRGVHLRNDVMVIRVAGILEERVAVDVQRGGAEHVPAAVDLVPRLAVRVAADDVQGLTGMVEVGDIYGLVALIETLVLDLRNQKLVLAIGEELPFVAVEKNEVTVHLRRDAGRETTAAALNPYLDLVIRECQERERL